MILGLSISAFTLLHVLLSLAGIATGLVAIVGLIYNRLFRAFTAVFLATTILTSATGFLFPFKGFTPGIILGILSIVALMIATVALYGQNCWAPGAELTCFRPARHFTSTYSFCSRSFLRKCPP